MPDTPQRLRTDSWAAGEDILPLLPLVDQLRDRMATPPAANSPKEHHKP